jgi:hypothetical protein
MVAFAALAFVFAQVQDVWIDESTQLSGITLPFVEMLDWLAGKDPGRFGVPGDRMPPVSYIIDRTWLGVAGPTEIGFRLLHAGFVLAGLTILAGAIWRDLKPLGTTIVLGALVLSPKLIETAVEIRSYPIFFGLTCLQFSMFVRIVRSRTLPNRAWLTSFVIVSLLATYTHFYGLVSGSAYFGALVAAYISIGPARRRVIWAYAGYLIGTLGVVPFVLAAEAQSRHGLETGTTSALVYLLKLLGDSPNMLSLTAAILYFGGLFMALSLSIMRSAGRVLSGDVKAADFIVLVIALGLVTTFVISFTASNFDALRGSYSIWLFAPLIIVAANGVLPTQRRLMGALQIAACSFFLAGAAVSTYLFFSNKEEFVHGPRRFVAELYDGTYPPKAIVYESGAAWPYAYFPLVFSYHGEIAQYGRSADSDALVPLATALRPNGGQLPPLVALAPYTELLLINIFTRNYRDLRLCNSGKCPAFSTGPVETTLISSGAWARTSVVRKFGLYDTEVIKLVRTK